MSAAVGGNARSNAGRASGSSFYAAMRILPKPQRDAMYAIYGFCRQVDDIADSPGAARPAPRRAGGVAQRHRGALPGQPDRRDRRPRAAGADLRAAKGRFPGRHRRDGNGCARRHSRPVLVGARSLLRPGGERGRAAVGADLRSRCRSGPRSRPSSRSRSPAHQHPARSRRGRRRRAALSAARGPASRPASRPPSRPWPWPVRRSTGPAVRLVAAARRHFDRAHAIMAASSRRAVRAPRIMGEVYRAHARAHGRTGLCAAAPAGPPRAGAARLSSSCATPSSDGSHRSHHRRRTRGTGRARSASPRTAWRPSSTRRPTRPAAAAARITTPPPACESTTAPTSCCRATRAALAIPGGYRRERTRHRRAGGRAILSSTSRPTSAGRSTSAPSRLLAVDVRCQAPRAGHPRDRLFAAASPAVAGARQDARRDHAVQRARPMNGWCSRSCSRRSTSIPARGRPISPARSCSRPSRRAARRAGPISRPRA